MPCIRISPPAAHNTGAPVARPQSKSPGGRIRRVEKARPGQRLAALLTAVALLVSTVVPAHAAAFASGNGALADVCRTQGNADPEGMPSSAGEEGCAACCLCTGVLPPSPSSFASPGPAFEAARAQSVVAPPIAVAGGNARAPPHAA